MTTKPNAATLERRQPKGEPPMTERSHDYIPHPLANMFPMIEGAEFENLRADIAANGIHQAITLFQGQILDGRNRYKAAKEAGHRFVPENFKEFSGTLAEAEAFVISTNVHRRHLNNKQKQDFIQEMIKRYPAATNRQIARLCQLSHATVAAVRDRMTNSPDVVRFNKFKDTWEDLPDAQRAAFVKEFEPDIRELLA
jgi:ParB-like chromosome segregation protein Spo0J